MECPLQQSLLTFAEPIVFELLAEAKQQGNQSQVLMHICRQILFTVLVLALHMSLGAQQVNLQLSASATEVNPETTILLAVDYGCASLTANCEDVVITGTVPRTLQLLDVATPSGVNYTFNECTREISLTMTGGAGDGLDAGSARSIGLTVRMPSGLKGMVAAVDFAISSSNAGSASDSEVIKLQNGIAPAGPLRTSTELNLYEVPLNGQISIEHRVGVGNFEQVDQFRMVDSFPPQFELARLQSPRFDNTCSDISLYYQTTEAPGVWKAWPANPRLRSNIQEDVDVSELGLNSGEIVTMVAMDFGDLTDDGQWFNLLSTHHFGRFFGHIRPVDWYGNPVSVGDQIRNCIYTEGRVNGTLHTSRECSNLLTVSAPRPKIFLDKWNEGAIDFVAGDTVLWHIDLYVPPGSSADLRGIVVMEELQPGWSLVPGSVVQEGHDNWITSGSPSPRFDILENYDGAGSTLLRWAFDDDFSNNWTLQSTGTNWRGFKTSYRMRIDPTVPLGTYPSNFMASVDSPEFVETQSNWGNRPNTFVDSLDFDLDSRLNDSISFVTAYISISPPSSAASINAAKWVRGELDAGYVRYPVIGTTISGGRADHRLVLTNEQPAPVGEFIIIETLSDVGDVGVISSEARGSEWKPVLAEAVTPPAGVTVYYSTTSNPCRDELAGSSTVPFPSGCTDAGWTTTPPQNITTVTALRFESAGTVLQQGEQLSIEWSTRAPVGLAEQGEVAWSSFGYTGTANPSTSPTILRPAEPFKVGFRTSPAILAGALGDRIWNDLDNDGIQDAGEPGLDGVRIELYADDGDGVREPNADDVLQTFTVSANGGQYLFSNLAAGVYFLRFSNLPANFSASPSLIGGNRFVDSEGITSQVTYISANEQDMSWDFGASGSSASCDLDISPIIIISDCREVSGISVADLTVDVSWTSPPSGEDIVVEAGGTSAIIYVSGGASSPSTVSLVVPANGIQNNPIFAHFSGGTCVATTPRSYDAPNQCGYEICDNGLDDDGDGLTDCQDLACNPGAEVYFTSSGPTADTTAMVFSTAQSWAGRLQLLPSFTRFEEPAGTQVSPPPGSNSLRYNPTTLNHLEGIAYTNAVSGFAPSGFTIDDWYPDFAGDNCVFLTTAEDGSIKHFPVNDPDDTPDLGAYYNLLEHQNHDQQYHYKSFAIEVPIFIDELNVYEEYFLDTRMYADGGVTFKINGEALANLSNSNGAAWYQDPGPVERIPLDPTLLQSGQNMVQIFLEDGVPAAGFLGITGFAGYARLGAKRITLEENLNDGRDNDCDSFVDCADPDALLPSPIRFSFGGAPTVTGMPNTVGHSARYPNVATVGATNIDVVGTVTALTSSGTAWPTVRFATNKVEVFQGMGGAAVGESATARVQWQLYEAGTNIPIATHLLFSIDDLDSNSTRVEYIGVLPNESQAHVLTATSNIATRYEDKELRFYATVDDTTLDPDNSVTMLYGNTSSFSVTYGLTNVAISGSSEGARSFGDRVAASPCPEDCADGIDNDWDSFIDCLDKDCKMANPVTRVFQN